MSQSHIRIRGARTHNLKNVSLDIPRDKFVVITGLSGSGKSSLAFDTLYAEGQRRYVESLSAYARQFLSQMEKPEVDAIEGLSPAIAIEQKSTSHNPRSTVGTITEIYDYLRLLYARVGTPYCPEHDLPMVAQTVSEMVDAVKALPEGTALMLLAPVVRERKGEYSTLFEQLQSQGFVRARVDGEIIEIDTPPELDKKKKHTIEVIVDRFKVRDDLGNRIAESFETALRLGGDLAVLSWMKDEHPDRVFSAKHSCPDCDRAVGDLEPRLFSFNNPFGACPACDGLGTRSHFSADKLIHNPELSISQGAIRGWDRQRPYYYSMLQKVAAHYDYSLETPWKDLGKDIQKKFLYGTGREKIDLSYVDERGRRHNRVMPFEGVLPHLERRYRETESNYVRDDLSQYLSNAACDVCDGSRLNEISRNVKILDHTISQITRMSIGDAAHYYEHLHLEGAKGEIGDKIFKEIRERLHFLVSVGLNYLSLARSAETLSGGEAQRIRLASQIGAGLMGVMYVLDEPSIGLHQRDNDRLLQTLIRLRDLGNTVLVVEHDEDAIRAADHIIDIGPGAGVHGGYVIAEGTADELCQHKDSLTGKYLSGELRIVVPQQRVQPPKPEEQIKLLGASGHNLKNVDLTIPLGVMTCVTGVSGSGKSTLINRTLLPLAATQLNGATTLTPEKFDSIDGLQFLDKVVDIDQSPIGRTPRSNPATYTGVFTPIRELFAQTQEAKARGYSAGRFSFNVKGGRCEACEGDGMIKVAMHFLPDMYVPCDACHGKRYNRETLEVGYKGKNISDVLEMTVEDAAAFFEAIPVIHRRLETLTQVGLGYIRLGQSATTLSGGEAQRVKLARELAKRDTGKTLYVLDEPTTGLHFHDIAKLLDILHELRNKGNTIVVIEHNLDVIKTADWVVDLGPEGGSGGGQIIATGTPEEVAEVAISHTGRFLKPLLK
ncbi:excinuclease ABC subunit A [Acinetobacter radioresistens DSM 6976 = NBRC 102413 = CIP 103788]|uniref:excinuclease ABC subunit UvrA n=1 Tax=Acinetobacter TaxID=469 RepID=UPI00028CBC8D|nr:MULTISPECIES: excinuclease ABC subunit UvrA [Acinetobacter]ENV90097.1 excinuclease ABC subunit A [Acinetobacter radioresistens DSM 6976 = NBRC 102413 = CIP 103788]MCU4515716.1 excinuclease ABC subunit UvrA [Acinetobacter radioresistens]MCU4594295.1 excinuclease ABC subunit UvrA [Acinetobacter radioresistens]PKD80114.1 excinuclease ABC subunit UvrA [Acinetobacter radioresistens]PSD36768.1 excinuclease ABC subunit UvrA [Acinetobacter radioresistens]